MKRTYACQERCDIQLNSKIGTYKIQNKLSMVEVRCSFFFLKRLAVLKGSTNLFDVLAVIHKLNDKV